MKGDRNGFAETDTTASITFSSLLKICLIGIFSVFSALGCAGSEKSNFFMIDSQLRYSPAPSHDGRADFSIGIGPVAIPEYLNRPQIVTRAGQYQIDMAEFDRWAEALETSIPRVMAENLSGLLSTDRVHTYPWGKALTDYQVRIDIIQFDGEIPGNVVLTARWTLLKPGGETRIFQKKYNDKKPIAGQGYRGMVSTMSLVLYDFSREIASAVKMEADGGALR